MIPLHPFTFTRTNAEGQVELITNYYTIFKDLVQEIKEDEDCRAFFQSVKSTIAFPFVACASGAHRVAYYFAGQFLGMAPPVATSTRSIATAALAEISVVSSNSAVMDAKADTADAAPTDGTELASSDLASTEQAAAPSTEAPSTEPLSAEQPPEPTADQKV